MGIAVKLRNKDDKAMHYCVSARNRLRSINFDKYGIQGVNALQSSTPVDTGKTADSWSYKVNRSKDGTVKIEFYNSNNNPPPDGVNIALLLQYGHATRSGSWVEGIDYINPAIASVFNEMAKEIWMEAIRA